MSSLKLTARAEELRDNFLALKTARDIADLLQVAYGILVYHVYKVPEDKKYTQYELRKKAGGIRPILAPATSLKIIQQKLNQVLQAVYQTKPCVHGFVRNRSVLSNATGHQRRRYVLNIDLKDFFPSINFGRVRGMFMAVPYGLPDKAATVLAQICCFRNELPQGAPTSPIVSNMVCRRMDSHLQQLALRHRCYFTRYADDITFSTSTREFPQAVARFDPKGQLQVGPELVSVIETNGFEINPDKVRLRTRYLRQEVTGLTVNEFPNVTRKYVRQIRAMLHAWARFGLEEAEREFHEKYDAKHRRPARNPSAFAKVVRGKIEYLGHIRGRKDRVYAGLGEKLVKLCPAFANLRIEHRSTASGTRPIIVTEGKSDWKHLKRALARLKAEGDYSGLDVEFNEYDVDMGGTELETLCRLRCKTRQPVATICVFDNDDKTVLKKISVPGEDYKRWGNRVYSFALPVPDHRKSAAKDICVELFYKDSEIMREDVRGRRLFLSYEFDRDSGFHLGGKRLFCPDGRRKRALAVLDNSVFKTDGDRPVDVALPKDDFAKYVLNEVDNFRDFDVSEFGKIFDVIAKIIEADGEEVR